MRPMLPDELGYPEPDQLIKVEPRTLVWRQTLPDGIPAVVKLYRRRGIHGLGGRCGLVRFRTAREYAALDHLTRHRIPCPEPLFWSHGVSAEHGQWEILATREIPGVLNIDDAIIVADTRDPLRLDLSRIFREASRIHRSGMLHGTLVARNILLEMRDGVACALYFTDMPRAVILTRDIRGSYVAERELMELGTNLKRLLGIKAERLPLNEYGLAGSELDRFLRRLEQYRPTKLQRRTVHLRAVGERLRTGAVSARRLSHLRPRIEASR
jgi:hypothetical protein